MKNNRLFRIFLVIFAAFLVCFTNVHAEDDGEEPEVKTGWSYDPKKCYEHPERALTIHYIIEGKEVNPSDPNAGSWYSVSGSKKYPCTSYSIPESYYNYSTGFAPNQKMFTNEEGTNGVIYWYDNPELTGTPVTHVYPDDDPDNNDIYLYASTGKIIEVYANGYKKKVVVGKMYSPATMDPDYYVEEGITHEYNGKSVNYWNYSTEADYFSYVSAYAENNSNPTYTYYRDKTATTGRSTILPAKAQYVHVDNTQLVQFINYESCRGNDNYLYCDIADPDTGEAMTSKQVQDMLDDEYAYSTVYIHDYNRIPKYYKYFGFIDTEGREYAQDFEMKEEYAGRAFTTVVDTKMSCATNYISPYHSNSYVARVYGTNINFDGAEYSGDFNTNYLTKLKSYYGGEYYADDKTNYYFSTCVPYDVNYKYTYKISKPNIRRYSVVLEGTEGVKVNQNSIYKLPTEGKPKSAETRVVTLKFQDGETADQKLTYTTTYTPTGFKIDGVHYGFGEEIVVTRDLYITYDYSSEVTGPDLPTPTRELYNFKGWYDATIGGHIVTDPKTLTASVLYAQWGDVDKVTIVRPDGIPIELEKGSSYTMPTISDKDEVVNSSVSFNYNDRSGRTDVSKVITYYKKNGIKDILTDEIYQEKETIIANNNMVLTENYIVTRVPATFPKTPTRNNYEFVGWYDSVEGGQQYTEYSGDQDLSLYARWEGDIEQVTIYFPDGFYVTIDKGESYTLPRIDSINEKYKVTFKYQDGETADSEQYVVHSYLSNGWIIDGDHYEAGETITPMEDVYLTEDFVEAFSYPTFENAPDKEWYTFLGWYDEAEEGTKYTKYEDFEEKTFYAHWYEIPYKDIVLPAVTPKAPDYYPVTFVYNNGDESTVSNVIKKYTGDGWDIDGEQYTPGSRMRIYKDTVMTPRYTESVLAAKFPAEPTYSGKMFLGWFDVDGKVGGTRYTSYNELEPLTLYGRWVDYASSYATMISGPDFQVKIKALLPNSSNGYMLQEATATQYLAKKEAGFTDANEFQTSDSPEKIYFWYEGRYVYYFSEAAVMYLNPDCSTMFKGITNKMFIWIDLSGFDFSHVTNMHSMFQNETNLTRLFFGENADTSHVTDMSYMFYWAQSIYNVDLQYWDTSSVEDLSYFMAGNCYTETDQFDLNDLDVSNVKNFEGALKENRSAKVIDISQWDTSSATNMKDMFYNNSQMSKLLMNNFDTSHVINMEQMFASNPRMVLLDLRSFDTHNVTNMSSMFNNNSVKTILVDGNKWSNARVTSSTVFPNSANLVGGAGTKWQRNITTGPSYAKVDGGTSNPGLLTDGSTYYVITLPDKQIIVPRGSEYTIPVNDYTKNDTTHANVTRYYHDDSNYSYSTTIRDSYTPDDWYINNTKYYAGDVITVNSDITLKPNYIVTNDGNNYINGAATWNKHFFLGWFTEEVGGEQVFSYSGEGDLVLHAHWGLVGEEVTLPRNYYPKNDDVYTVTFKFQNGEPDYTSTVVYSYTPNGWKVNGVHRDEGYTFLHVSSDVIEKDYIVTITPATFPETPQKDGFTFTGWFDKDVGGNIFTSYSKAASTTLYAYYVQNDTPIPLPNDVLCKRANTLHSQACSQYGVCNSKFVSDSTMYYGNIGISGYLSLGDAFTCDVNGDGIFDEEEERFYYVSDYYDLATKTYDNSYASLIYYKNFGSDTSYSDHYYQYDYDEEVYAADGPTTTINQLPTTSQWPNSSLKTTSRRIYAAYMYDLYKTQDSHSYNEEMEGICDDPEWGYCEPEYNYTSTYVNYPTNFSYEGKAARLLTIYELLGAIGQDDYPYYSYERTLVSLPFLTEGGSADGGDYWLENPYDTTTGNYVRNNSSGGEITTAWVGDTLGARPVIDVPKTRMEITKSTPNTHTITLPDYTIEVEHGSLFTIPINNYNKPKEDVTVVTFDFQYDREDEISKITKTYTNNGFTIGEDHYDDGTVLVVESDLVINPDYVESTQGSIQYPYDTQRENYLFEGWYTEPEGGQYVSGYSGPDSITLYAHWRWQTPVTPEPGRYTLPTNNHDKASDEYAVTFEPQNGYDPTIGYVYKTYTPNGWLVNGIHYNDGETIDYELGTTIVEDYETTTVPVTFPANPVKNGFEFVGWFDAPNGGNQILSYSTEEATTLYAHYSGTGPIVFPEGTQTLPKNDLLKADQVAATVTYDPHNGEAPSLGFVLKRFTPNGWLVDGVHYDDYEVVTITDETVVAPDYKENYISAIQPNNPEKEGYRFTGWYTSDTNGTKVTVYNTPQNITLHAQYTDSYAIIKNGYNFKYSNLTPMLQNHTTYDLSFRKATAAEFARDFSTFTDVNDVSDENSPNPVYVWLDEDNNNVLYYSEADVIYTDKAYYMFRDFKQFVSIDISGINTSYSTDFSSMFYGCSNVTSLILGDIDTSKATSISGMFALMSKVTSIDTSHFDTANVTSMGSVFFSCKKLQSVDVSTFNTSKARFMNYMFRELPLITSFDLSHFDFSNVIDMNAMFAESAALKTVDLSSLRKTQITDFSEVFSECPALESVNISNFDTSEVTRMYSVFKNCRSLTTLDLSSFDTRNVEDFSLMFHGNNTPGKYNVLRTIYVSENWDLSKVEEGSDYGNFYYNTSIMGGQGTTYKHTPYQTDDPWMDDDYASDVIYARIDGGTSRPGYLTLRDAEPLPVPTIYTVTLPDRVDYVEEGGIYTIPNNTYDKDNTTISTVTLVYNDGVTQNSTLNYSKSYTPNGFKLGSTHYDSADTLVINENIVLDPDYIETTVPVELPTPTRQSYNFDGWYSAQTGGQKYTSYSSTSNITLYARWNLALPEPGEEFILPLNNKAKANGTFTVTFNPLNNSSVTTSTVTVSYTPNGWLVDGVHYNDGETITYEEGMSIVEDYTITVVTPATFPANPTKDGYEFVGWFDSETNGSGTKYTSYSGASDITLYAHYKNSSYHSVTLPDYVDYVEHGTSYIVPANTYTKASDVLATVTFDYQFSEVANTTGTVNRIYTPNGFTIDGVHYDSDSSITVNEDIVLTPEYVETIAPVTFPDVPTRSTYTFEGWYTAANGGTKVTTYSKTEDVTLYAHWTEITPEPGTLYTLPTNDVHKAGGTYTVIFKFQNGDPDTTRTFGIVYTPNGWKVNGVHKENGETILIKEDTKIEPDYIVTSTGDSFPANPTREDYEFVKWADAPQGGNVYTLATIDKDLTLYAQWNFIGDPHIIPENTKCIRARQNPSPGTYGSDDVNLDAGNAFDCDTDGNGTFETRFYYVSDYYDPDTGEFDHDYAVLIADSLETEYQRYNTSSNVNGPVTAITALPSTSEWSNITLHKTSRQLRTVNGNTSFTIVVDGVSNLPTADYSNKAARLLTIQEVNEGCGMNITSSNIYSYESVPDKCRFLFENLGIEPEYPWDPEEYYDLMLENLVDNSRDFAILHSSGKSVSAISSSAAIKATIEVPKENLDLAIVPSYFTVDYSNGRVDTVNNRLPYKLAGATEKKDSINVATVTFKQQNGEDDYISYVTENYTHDYWYSSDTGYITPGNTTYVNQNLVLKATFKATTKGAQFPANPTKEGYSFVGWYDQPKGGNVVSSYSSRSNKTLYAQYIKVDNEGKITLSKNETPKANKDYIDYDFYGYEMVDDPGTPGEMMREQFLYYTTSSIKSYTPNGWLVDGVHYDDYEKVSVTPTSIITPDYIETIIPGVMPTGYPEDTEGGEFIGWYSNDNLITTLDFVPANGRTWVSIYPEYTYENTIELIQGSNFNTKLKSLISASGYTGNNLTFRKATSTEYNNVKSTLTNANIVSIEQNYKPAYLWVDATNELVLYYSESETIYMNENSSNMFNDVDKLKTVDLSGLSSIYVTNMSGLFDGSDNITSINLTGINTGQVTDMSYMFSNMPNITSLTLTGISTGRATNMEGMFSGDSKLTSLDLKSFNTSSVTNTSNMFKGDTLLATLNVTTFDVSNVTNMSSMFEGCSSLSTIDTSRFITTSATNMSNMFKGDSSLTNIDFHAFKVENVTDMSSMFEGCTSLASLNISSFNPASLTNTSSMFKGDTNLTTVYVSSDWTNENITSSNNMFIGATSIVGQEGTTYNVNFIDKTYARVDIPDDNKPGYFTLKGISSYEIYIDDELVQKVNLGEVFILPSVTSKDPTKVSTITFKYLDGKTADTTADVTRVYTADGFVEGNNKYAAGDVITVEGNMYLNSNYTDVITSPTFPSPTRSGYTFVGWVAESTFNPDDNLTTYSSYDGTSDITLYAQWRQTADGTCSITYVGSNDVDIVECGTSVPVPMGMASKVETLTFNYINTSLEPASFTEEYSLMGKVSYVTDQDGNTYTPGQNITVNGHVIITPTFSDYMIDGIIGAEEFRTPDDAYRFVGWFSSLAGGKQIHNYNEYLEEGLTSRNLYAHSNEEGKCSVILDGVEVGTYDCGSTYTLPAGSNVDQDVATVTFINGDTTTVAKVHETKTFDEYKVIVGLEGTESYMNPSETVTVSDNVYITSEYNDETITPVAIPNLSDTDYYTFEGWFTEPSGEGFKFVTGNYSSKVDLTLYSYFVGKKALYTFYDPTRNASIGTMEAPYGSEIDTSSIRNDVTTTSEYTIKYVYNNGTDNFIDRSFDVSDEIVSWYDGTNKPYALVHTVDVVGPISLNAVFGNSKIATNITLETPSSDIYPGYDFAGWYTLPVGGTVVTASDIKENKDYILYAHWTRNNTNICILDDGTTMECPLGASLVVPNYSESIEGRVNEIINGTADNYKDQILNTYEVVKTSYIDYAIVDGVKYYPGDTYTIGVNPEISIVYKSFVTEPVTLDTSVNVNNSWFTESDEMLFTGWFTERTGGDQVFKYDGNENINVYAHYKVNDPSEETFTLRIEGLDGNVITQENISKNTKVKLFKDTYINKAQEIKLYDSDGTSLISTVYINYTHEADKYLVNGVLVNVGNEITITSDTYIKAYETNVTRAVNGYKEPTTAGFTGYFTAVQGGNKVDVELLKESDNKYNKLYAHYHGETPQGYVSVDFDGDIYDVQAGSAITLPLDKEKDSTSFKVKFNFSQANHESYDAYVVTNYELVGFKVNNQAYNPGSTVTADTDLVIRSQYSESKTWDDDTYYGFAAEYPAFPEFTFLTDQPSSWVINLTTGETIDDASTLTDNTELFAHYSQYAKVYLGEEIIAQVKKGSNYQLPLNNYNKASDTIGSVTFVYDNGSENTVSNVYKVYTPNGWYIGETEYVSGANVTVNDDITIVPKYKETITAAKFPKNPTKEHASFQGWFTSLDENGEQITSYNGTDNITVYAKWKNQYKIVDPTTGETEYVDEGTVITLETLSDKAEKFYDITFNYNYTGAPADKVVRISTQEKFKGWLINGVLKEAGEQITIEEDITKVASYEKVVNNKNLPNNPARDGYTFKGWYNSASELFGSLVDVTKLETNATVYAHWEEFNPETQVTLTWDGVPTVHDIGTVINLEKDGTTTTDNIATITFIMNKEGVSDKIVKITRTTFVDHLVINGTNHEATGTYTLNRDTVITSVFETTTTYPQLPVVSDSSFSGFYTAPEGGDKVTTLDGIVEDKVFYAQYNGGGTVPAIIDGEEVEVSKTYTVPSLYGDPSTITINLDLNYEGAPSATEMTISTQRKVLSQTIDGITYTPGSIVKLKAGSKITTNLSDEYETTRTPEYTKPSDVEISGNTYTFEGWYDTDPTEFISVTNLTGNDSAYNNHTLHASWMYKYDDMVTLHVINGAEEKYIQLTPGTSVDVSSYVKADITKSINIPFKDTTNYSQTENAGTISISQAYGAKKVTLNNIAVTNNYVFDIDSDTTLEITYGLKGSVNREVNSTNNYNFLLQTPPVTLDDIIYKGLYTSDSEQGTYVNVLNLTVLDTNYDNNVLYVRYADKDSNTTLTIDGVTTVVPKGDITLPGATSKASDIISVKYDYNDGSNYTYTQNITKSYTFAHFKLIDNEASVTEYAAGSTYNITKPTEFNSVFTESYRYPSTMHTLTEDGFLGWYTAKTGGTKVTKLDGITTDTTLYARWDSSMYYTVPEASGETKSIQVYFDQNYDGAPTKQQVTVTSQKAVLYQTVNGVVHTPGDVIRIDGELDVKTVLSDDFVTTFTPEISDPQDRGNYYFTSWGIQDDIEWQDGDTIDNHLTAFNIENLSGYKDGYNNLTLYAMWDEHAIVNPEDRVMLKVITPTSITNKEFEKGSEITVSTLAPSEFTSSINVGLYDDNSSYNANIITTRQVNKVLFNNDEVSYNGSVTLNSNGTIEYTYTDGTTVRSGDYPAYVEQKAPYVHDGIVYVGIYESNENNSKLIDFLGIKGTDLDHKDKNYYIKNNDDSNSEYTYLYLDDNAPVQIPMGAWTTPSATTKDSDNILVTFDYNDNSGRTTQKAIVKTYTFDHFHVDGVGEDLEHDVDADASYNVTHYLVMHSVFNSQLTYPDMLTINAKEFEGWYTAAIGGTKVSTLDGITEPTTLYAHYSSIPDPTVLTFDGVIYIVPAGVDRINPLNEGYATNQIVKKAILTLVLQDTTETHSYNSTIDHIGWTDENGNEFGETIDLTSDNIGVTFTSRYSYENVDDVDLSRYNPDDDKFEGWFTSAVGGTKETTYTPVEDETYYAHYFDVSQVTITVDDESELHAVGSTYTLPDAKSKTVPNVVITFDHNDGLGTTTTKSFDTVYTFAGYRLASDNTLYDANAVFNDIQTDMTFTSEFTKSTSTPTWPENPTKENYIFVGWYTAKDSGLEVFNYDDITTNTTLYAHYVRNDEDFVTITNSVTGEFIKVLAGSDFVFADSKFNKASEESLGTGTFKFNASGYPDEVVEFKVTHTPSGYYIGDDSENIIGINSAHQFTSDATITPYYNEADDVDNTDISLDMFDYTISKEDASPVCFSLTNQTDPRDNDAYECYNKYSKADGNVTLYLHWAPVKAINVTKPDGTVEVYNIYDTYDLGTNNITGPANITYNVNLIYHDGETADGLLTYSKTYANNGWLVTGSSATNYNDDETIELVEDILIEPNYTETESTVTLPTPTKDDYTFVGWNSLETGLGKYYTDSDINNITESGELTLHAVWTQEQTVTITFDSQGGSNVSPRTITYNSEIGQLPETEKTGYTFKGWYTDTTYTTLVTDTTKFKYDTTLYAKWVEDVTPGPGEVTVTYPDSHIEVVPTGTVIDLGTIAQISKPDYKIATMTFKYQDEATADTYRYVYKSYTQSGWAITNDYGTESVFASTESYTVNENITILPNYIETTISDSFPDDPIRDEYTFTGWVDKDNTSYTSYTGEEDITLYASWTTSGPTAIDVTSNALILVKGEEEQIVVTTTPENLTGINYTYTVDDDEIISVSDEGVVTALSPGTTTVTIAVENNPSVSTEISVTVINNRITSQTLTVADKDLTGEDIRIIIDAEPKTKFDAFLANIDNDLEYIQVYDKDDQLVAPSQYDKVTVTTGCKLKLVINDTEHDNVIVIIRGDVNEDGLVDISDRIKIQSHILKQNYITGYKLYAADVVERPGVTADKAIDVTDAVKINGYILKQISSLNEKDGD